MGRLPLIFGCEPFFQSLGTKQTVRQTGIDSEHSGKVRSTKDGLGSDRFRIFAKSQVKLTKMARNKIADIYISQH
jgi:hypothetical protein